MKRILIAIVISILYSLDLFSKDNYILSYLDSDSLFKLESKDLSIDTISSNYIQIRNVIARYNGCENKYYSLGTYAYKNNNYEIIQFTNGYVIFTYLVVKKNGGNFPQMLLIDKRIGYQIMVSFRIEKGFIYLSYIERCGEFPITIDEIYQLDCQFSSVKTYGKEPYENITVKPM